MDEFRKAGLLLLYFPVLFVSVNGLSTREIPCNFPKLYMDIAVAIDYSNNMGVAGISQVVSNIASIFHNANISQGRGQFSRISITNYTSTVNRFTPSTSSRTRRCWRIYIQKIIPKNTNEPAGNITMGLLEAFSSFKKRFPYPEVQWAILLFASDYDATNMDRAVKESQSIRSSGINIIVIDSSKAQNINGLASIASPGMVFLANDPLLINKTQTALCISNAYCDYSWTQVTDSYPNGTDFKGECVQTHYYSPASGSSPYKYCCNGAYPVNVLDNAKQNFVDGLAQAEFGKLASYWIGLRYSIRSAGWYQQQGDPAIPVSASNYSNWYPGYSLASLTADYPYAAMKNDENAKGWITSIDSETIMYRYICQKITCDTENYCKD